MCKMEIGVMYISVLPYRNTKRACWQYMQQVAALTDRLVGLEARPAGTSAAAEAEAAKARRANARSKLDANDQRKLDQQLFSAAEGGDGALITALLNQVEFCTPWHAHLGCYRTFT